MSNGAPQYPHSSLSDLEIRVKEKGVQLKATGESERIIAWGIVGALAFCAGWRLASWMDKKR